MTINISPIPQLMQGTLHAPPPRTLLLLLPVPTFKELACRHLHCIILAGVSGIRPRIVIVRVVANERNKVLDVEDIGCTNMAGKLDMHWG
ncbi:unnamed protein product [Linum trigynum]|uniref:Uncharacterized protein n=1 Tax=Linum trigynum TaxID=586398 RepID=A0AAV2EZU8_9ROSI